MKILWITNIALPPICEAMGWSKPTDANRYDAEINAKLQTDIYRKILSNT